MQKSITLLRHAHTSHNGPPKRFQGRLDVDISPIGVNQCRNAKHEFEWVEHIVASPAKRVQQSVEILFASHQQMPEIILDDGLWEIDNGWYSGKLESEVESIDPEGYKLWLEHPDKAKPGGGETLSDMLTRANSALSKIKASYRENTLVVTHGGIMRVLILESQNRSLNEFHQLNISNLESFKLEI